MLAFITLFALAYIQSVSFSIVSRSRNRDSARYHIIASVFSNSIWFLTFRELVLSDMSLMLFPFYCVGTVAGSQSGVYVSKIIERWLSIDEAKRVDLQALETRLETLESIVFPATDYSEDLDNIFDETEFGG